MEGVIKKVEKTAKLKELAVKRKSTAKEEGKRMEMVRLGELGERKKKMLLHKMMVEKFFTD